MRKKYYIDMHIHPHIKPYSWYISDRKSSYELRNIVTSLWYDDPPKEFDKEINKYTGLTRFTQSDFRTLTKGDVKISSAALGPVERGLFVPRGPWEGFGLHLLKFGLELNPEFIKKVKEKKRDYFKELKDEYRYFLLEQDKQKTHIFPTLFVLTRNFSDIEPPPKEVESDKIFVFFSIEGSHAFNNGGLENMITDPNVVRQNIEAVKAWEYCPLYVSIAHTMYNGLCGHAESLPPKLGKLVDHTVGMDTGFTDMGKVVVHELLDNTKGKRIHIDIKHMSAQSRVDYYEIYKEHYQNKNIPILVSHGAVNGLPKVEDCDQKETNKRDEAKLNDDDRNIYQNEAEVQFYKGTVNFFDDEIIKIQKSEGFLGVMIDERRLISPEDLEEQEKKDRNRGEQLYHQAGLIWKQIRYITEILDKDEKYGWGTATIGSDYDGAVNPPNGFWTADDFGILEENLIHHAVEYFKFYSNRLKHPPNQLNHLKKPEDKAMEVIDLVLRRNAERFLAQFFI